MNSVQLRYGKLCCAKKASTELVLFITEISLSVSVTRIKILPVIVKAKNSGYEF